MQRIVSAWVCILLLGAACTPQQSPGPSATRVPTALRAPTAERAPTTAAGAGPTRPASPAAAETLPQAPPATAVPGPAAPAAPAEPDGGAYHWAPYASGLDQPVAISAAGDGSGRLFISEQPGRVRVIENGAPRAAPFLDITALVGSRGSEQGLLSAAFHPDYARSGTFFVDYTDTNGDTAVARYRVAAGDANRADASSAQILLHVDQPYANHNGGQLQFGADGYLYVGMGDGGSAGDPQGRAQNLDTLLGKLLRLDVDHGEPYRIPPDNPFAGNNAARAEIWAYGLRNPWRFSFDRLTHDLYLADVGQGQWEEVDFSPAASAGGENYGWNYREGAHSYQGNAPEGLVEPVAEYSHAEGGCAITGGYVYRGQSLPALQGVYLYGDYCSGLVWGLWRDAQGAWQHKLLFRTGLSISTFGEDEQGELYLADRGGGAVYRLEAAAP